MKLYNRVTLTGFPAGHPLSHREGERGGVVQFGSDGPASCPLGCEDFVLVDSQYVNGKEPQGELRLREWVDPIYLEIG